MPQRLPSSVGVIYIAFGAKYKESAVLSILWLRRFGYSGPVRVVTGDEYWPVDILDCEVVRVPHVGDGFTTRYYKTQINTYSYDTTLFLDADTLPIASISKIWRELRFAEMCVSMDLFPNIQNLVTTNTKDRERRESEYQYMSALGLLDHPLYSSGVMLFRRSAGTDQLFTIWHEEWNRFRHEDQLALVRAIARTGFKVRTLAPRWNARLKGFGTIENARLRGVRIIHFRPGNAHLVRALLDQPALPGEGRKRPLRKRLRSWIHRLKLAVRAS
jgi:hypothetical protein